MNLVRADVVEALRDSHKFIALRAQIRNHGGRNNIRTAGVGLVIQREMHVGRFECFHSRYASLSVDTGTVSGVDIPIDDRVASRVEMLDNSIVRLAVSVERCDQRPFDLALS